MARATFACLKGMARTGLCRQTDSGFRLWDLVYASCSCSFDLGIPFDRAAVTPRRWITRRTAVIDQQYRERAAAAARCRATAARDRRAVYKS